MKRKDIRPGQYFLCTIGCSDSNIGADYTGEHPLRVSRVDGEMVELYNLTLDYPDTTMKIEYLLDDDTMAIDDDMAARIWRACVSFTHQNLIHQSARLIHMDSEESVHW
jgi:hypothetical protein